MNEQTKAKPAPQQSVSAPMPTREENKPLAKVQTLGELFKNAEFKQRVAQCVPRHVNEERMLRTFALAAQAEAMRDVTLMSFIGACLTTSQLGLEPNNPLGHAYLIPFGVYEGYGDQRKLIRTDVQYIPGYKGLMELSYRSGKVISMHPDVVWAPDEENGRFEYHYGTGAKLIHRPLYVPRDPDAEDPLYAYCHADLIDGQAFMVWPWAEVMRIRDRSEGFKSARTLKERHEKQGWRVPPAWLKQPWVAHRIAMGRKTMVRAISNLMPRSIELASAVHLDERQDRKPADFSRVIDADPITDAEGRQTRDYIGAATAAADQADVEGQEEERATRQQEGRAGSAGAAFTDRRPAADTKPKPERVTATPQPPAPAPFEVDLIDLFGEITGTYDSAVAFAKALLDLWGKASDEDETAALLEYNADSIADARATPEAAALLDQLNTPRVFDTEPLVFTPVEPPLGRDGKPDWMAWLKLCKAEIAQTEPAHVALWADAHRAILPQAPSGPRIQVVRTLDAALSGAGLERPSWLGEVIAAKAPVAESKPAAPPSASAAASVESAPPASAPADRAASAPADRAASAPADRAASAPADRAAEAKPPEKADADTIWARRTVARLAQYTNTKTLREEVFASAVVGKMTRLKETRPDLFNLVNNAATRRMHDLSVLEQQANEPPPPEDGDPGPGA